jgi:stalled ribosome rescue protein Dom34
MSHFHAAVWIDHRLAHIYKLNSGNVTTKIIRNPDTGRIHHKAGSIGAGHSRNNQAYFEALATELADAKAILILGPAQTKDEFKSFLESHLTSLNAKVVGVETLDRETDKEVIAFARKLFSRSDRMTPQRN